MSLLFIELKKFRFLVNALLADTKNVLLSNYPADFGIGLAYVRKKTTDMENNAKTNSRLRMLREGKKKCIANSVITKRSIKTEVVLKLSDSRN